MIEAAAGPSALFGSVSVRPQTMWGLTWKYFLRHRPAVISAIVLLIIFLLVTFANVVSPYDPDQSHLSDSLSPPTLAHPMGTDELGRDLATRILYGGRISLLIGITSMLLAVSGGSLVGAAAGYYGGAMDNLLMRLTDLFLAFPSLILAIVLVTLLRQVQIPVLDPSSATPIILVIAVTSWTTVARLVRAAYLSLREKDFVEAARAVGAGNRRIIFRHILPNAISPIIVAATLRVADAIITESGLSYLGLGVQLPTATWGNILKYAQDQMIQAPWTAIFPGLTIFVVVIAINYIGDGLRDALDPHHVQ